MKRINKFFSAIVLFIMCLTTASCGGNKNNSESVNGKNPFELKVFNFNGGFGSEWLTALEKRYEAEQGDKKITINGKVYDGVDVKIESVKKTMEEMATSFTATNHVYFQEDVWYMNYLRGNNIFEDITEALTADNPYEPGVKLESKLSNEQKEYYNVGGKYYGVPHYTGFVGITYDVDLFNNKGFYLKENYTYGGDTSELALCFTKNADEKSAGPDGIKGDEDDGLPTTYDEFFMLCGYMSQRNVMPITWSNNNRQKYLNWFLSSLATSYEGLQSSKLNFTFKGNATSLISADDSGKVTALGESAIDSANGYELAKQGGNYYGLSFMEKIVDENWYQSKDGTNHTDAQDLFIMGDEAGKKTAMLIDGVWWEMEASSTFASLEQSGLKGKKDLNYAFMPLPAATTQKAEERKENISQGKKGYTLLDTHNSLCFIGKGISADEKKIAIDFIQFANTDKSLTEFSEITDTTKALSYTMSESDKNGLSSFGRSIVSMQERSDIVYTFSSSLFYQNNETTFSDYDEKFNSTVDGKMLTVPVDAFMKGVSAKSYFDGLYTYSKEMWKKLA